MVSRLLWFLRFAFQTKLFTIEWFTSCPVNKNYNYNQTETISPLCINSWQLVYKCPFGWLIHGIQIDGECLLQKIKKKDKEYLFKNEIL